MNDQEFVTQPLKSPLYVELSLTTSCNHKCLHCYNPYRFSEDSVHYFSDVHMDQLRYELEKNEVFHLVISGGEPLVNWPLLESLLQKMQSSPVVLSLNSNLSLATEDRIEKLQALGVEQVLTSFPSSSSTLFDQMVGAEGAFDKVVRGIKLCIAAGMELSVNMVVSKQNLSSLRETCAFLASLGVKHIAATIVTPPDFNRGDSNYNLDEHDIHFMADTLLQAATDYDFKPSSVNPIPLCVLGDAKKYEKLIKRSCGGGITHMTINPQGEALACSHESDGYGNVFEDGLSAVWGRMSSWRRGENLHNECLHCSALDLCGGECRIITQAFPDRNFPRRDCVENIDEVLISQSGGEYLPNDLFRVSEQVKIRKEEFGAVINRSQQNILLAEAGVELIQLIEEHGALSLSALMQIVPEYAESLPQVISYLTSVGILTKE